MNYYTDDHYKIKIHHVLKYIKQGDSFAYSWSTRGRQGASFSVRGKPLPKDKGILLAWHNNGELVSQVIRFNVSSLTYGDRLWWSCPICSSRCAALFHYGKSWGCRKCGNLKYKSAYHETKNNRVFEQLQNTMSKVKDPSRFHAISQYLEPWDKPKRMRWDTWSKIMDKHNKSARRALMVTCEDLGIDYQ